MSSSRKATASSLSAESKTRRLVLYVVVFFLVWVLRVFIYRAVDGKLGSEFLTSISAAMFHITLMAVPVFLYLRFVDHTNPLEYLRLSTNIRKGIIWGIMGSAGLFVLSYFCFIQLGQAKLDWDITGGEWINIVFIATIAEEILFRGFFLHKIGEQTSFLQANLITSLLFVAIHWPGWLWLSNSPMLNIIGWSISFLVIGAILGYLVKLANSLWPAVLIHAALNLIFVIILL